MVTRAKKEVLEVVPLVSYAGRPQDGELGPPSFGPLGDSITRSHMPKSIAAVLSDSGVVVMGSVYVHPNIPTFCGGLIAVNPSFWEFEGPASSEGFPTVPYEHAHAAALLAAIVGAGNVYGKYLASMFGPLARWQEFGQAIIALRALYSQFTPHVRSFSGGSMRPLVDADVRCAYGNFYNGGRHYISAPKLRVGPSEINPNSGNRCAAVTVSARGRQVYGFDGGPSRKDSARLLSFLQTRAEGMLPPRPNSSTGEVQW